VNIAVVDTGLFPDRETLQDAVTALQSLHNVYRYDATRPELTEADWDRALDEMLACDLVITL
jgi:hypothetical protein